VNLYLVYVAVGGLAFMVSAMSDRRGRAIGVIFGLLLGSFLLNFLAQFWPPAGRLSFLGVLDYYKPAQILTGGSIPIRDIVGLLGFGLATWAIGGEILARRSICTV
jgi:ABC-2 type transport system permease protein